jgi:hypothetical protein
MIDMGGVRGYVRGPELHVATLLLCVARWTWTRSVCGAAVARWHCKVRASVCTAVPASPCERCTLGTPRESLSPGCTLEWWVPRPWPRAATVLWHLKSLATVVPPTWCFVWFVSLGAGSEVGAFAALCVAVGGSGDPCLRAWL